MLEVPKERGAALVDSVDETIVVQGCSDGAHGRCDLGKSPRMFQRRARRSPSSTTRALKLAHSLHG